jgi:dihydrolipoamide dehydrogenase
VGGGAIGLELGSVWSRLGSEVTVVELLPQILPGWDSQIARLLARLLTAQGIKILSGTKITGYTQTKSGVTLQAENGKALSLKASKVLVAIGRRPCTADLGLELLGIELDSTGRVAVDAGFQTNVPGIYAIGDLIPGPMLAHKAGEEGAAVAEILAGKAGQVNEDAIPGVVYTWPEAAALGATEEQLKEQGRAYSKGVFYFRANGRALAMDSPDGLVKILSDQVTDRLLGMHILGPWASDLIAEGVAVMEFGGSAEDIARTVHAHPTLAEVVKEAALDADGRAIHAPPVGKKT